MSKFKYSYSALVENEREEVKYIKSQYEELKSEDKKLITLRKLDKKVKTLPVIFSLTFGIVSLLVFGVGLTLAMEWGEVIWGIFVGLLGVFGMVCAYFIYNIIYTKLKAKYAPIIIKLSGELLNEKN